MNSVMADAACFVAFNAQLLCTVYNLWTASAILSKGKSDFAQIFYHKFCDEAVAIKSEPQLLHP